MQVCQYNTWFYRVIAISGVRRLINLCGRDFRMFIFFTKRSLIPLSLLRQVHSVFQNELSTECDIVIPVTIYSILAFS
jgi:hypothetical protein